MYITQKLRYNRGKKNEKFEKSRSFKNNEKRQREMYSPAIVPNGFPLTQ